MRMTRKWPRSASAHASQVWSDAPVPCSRMRGGSENLAKAHPRLGHQVVLLARIGVDGAEIGSEKYRSSSGKPGSQLAERGTDQLLLSRDAVVPQEVLPHCERRCQACSPLLHRRPERLVARAGSRRV